MLQVAKGFIFLVRERACQATKCVSGEGEDGNGLISCETMTSVANGDVTTTLRITVLKVLSTPRNMRIYG